SLRRAAGRSDIEGDRSRLIGPHGGGAAVEEPQRIVLQILVLAVAICELVVHYRSGRSSQQERGEKPGVGHSQCASYDTVSKKSMRTLFVSLLLLIAPAFAGDEQFNG